MKKFTVHLSYHGCFTTEVEVADDEAALEAARDEAARLNPKDFILALEPIENGHDIEEIPQPETPKKTMYQPQWYDDDGTNVDYGNLPEGLSSFHVFATRGSCAQWLRDHGYDPGDFAIIEYREGDIEDPVFLDA